MATTFEGKVAVVTGAFGVLGAAVARRSRRPNSP